MVNLVDRMISHPRTSAVGVLIGLTTVLGVLQQHGVSWGEVGSGSGISLASGLAAALLGLLAKD